MDTLTDVALGTASRCFHMFKLRWVDNLVRPPGFASVARVAAKAGIEADLTCKLLEGDEGLPINELDEVAEKAGKELIATHGFREVPEGDRFSLTSDNAIRRGIADAKTHAEAITPEIEPIAISDKYEIKVDGLPMPLSGTIPVVGAGCAYEYQFRRHTKDLHVDADDLCKNLRCVQSSMAHEAMMGEPGKLSMVTPHIGGILDVPLEERDKLLFVDRVKPMMTMIQAGLFPPVQHDHPTCNAWRCGYWEDACPYGRRQAMTI